MTSVDGGIGALLDRVELQELFNRYCDALDRRRFEDLQDVFTEDVVTEWPRDRTSVGREATIGHIVTAFQALGPTHHHVGNLSTALDGDRARASVRVRAYHAGSGDLAHLFEESLAAFEAHAVRTADGWRFDRWSETIYIVLGTREVFRDGEA